MSKFAILLPPSVQQTRQGNRFAPDVFDYREKTTFNYFHQLIAERRYLIDTLHRVMDVEGEDVVAEVLGDPEAVTLMKNVYSAELVAARKRYEAGPMYAAMDFPRLPTGAQRRFLENSVIISGLFGILRPDDLTPRYVLPIDAVIPGIGYVADYWRPLVSPFVNEAIRDCFVWDLLTDVHRSAWDDAKTYSARACVTFYDRQGVALTDTLALRGKLVHHLVQQNHVKLDTVKTWKPRDAQGYQFDEDRSDLSDPTSLVVALSKK